MKKNQKGVTLVELLIVIVILGIIASISIPAIGRIVENTRKRADYASLIGLNQATYYLALSSQSQLSQFVDLPDDEARITFLQDTGFITGPVTPQHQDSNFFWDQEMGLWCNIVCVSNQAIFDFSFHETLMISSDNSSHSGHWDYDGDYLEGRFGLTFIDNPRKTYSVEVEAQLGEGTSGGFGVVFETRLSGNSARHADGYIVQFDRGLSQIVVVPIENGAVKSPVLRYNVIIDGTNVSFTDSGGTENNRDNPWWSERHTIRLSVSQGTNDEKLLSVWINGQNVFENWDDFNPVPFSNYSENKIGLRAWGVPTRFYSVKIN